jgi:uncharacterized protein YjbJ (UPF0337 family)
VKETAGKVLDKPCMEAQGTNEKIVGKVQKNVGKIERVLEK